MEEKKPFGERLEAFFAGKGFYIVLLLCVAVIGVSAWSMLNGGGSKPAEEEFSITVADMEDKTVKEAALPAANTPAPASKPKPPETPEPTAEPKPEATPAPTAAPAAPTAQETRDYFIWPVSGDLAADYAMASLVYDRTMRDWRTHDGVDIAAEVGTQVRAAANGTVREVYSDERYGTTVVIDHKGGLSSVYANLAETPAVTEGQTVGVGEVIGAVGTTALCEIGETGHLHFAMRLNGESADPHDYLP